MKIHKTGTKDWTNAHFTFRQKVTDLWDLANDATGTALQAYNDTTRGIQKIIADCIKSGTPLRALGGNWSLSPIAATTGIILNTKPLNAMFSVSAASASPQYASRANRLVFAQCGASVWELNNFLHARSLSLCACGASNGQTIAGAIATGTHGAAVGFGGIQDAVVGLHLIVGEDKHVYLERALSPAVNDTFIQKLGATPLRDDEAFDAALVSFGCFGFVMGVMIEAEDNYLLEASLRRVPYDAAYRKAVLTPDFSFAALPNPGEAPFHFQTAVNPYNLDKGVYITTMYKRPYKTGYTPPKPNGEGIGPGDDAACFIGKVGDAAPALVPTIVNRVLGASLTPYEKTTGRLGEIFSNTVLRGKVASAAFGIRTEDVTKVLDLLLEVNKKSGPFAGLFAFRYVKASRATMAFTRFKPVTVVLELDGVLSTSTRVFYAAVCHAMEAANIPFTYHWGKMNLLNEARIRRMYGADFDRFLAARGRVVDADVLRIFSNDCTRAWGIDEPVAGGVIA